MIFKTLLNLSNSFINCKTLLSLDDGGLTTGTVGGLGSLDGIDSKVVFNDDSTKHAGFCSTSIVFDGEIVDTTYDK